MTTLASLSSSTPKVTLKTMGWVLLLIGALLSATHAFFFATVPHYVAATTYGGGTTAHEMMRLMQFKQ